MSGRTDGGQKTGERTCPRLRSRRLGEITSDGGAAAAAPLPMTTGNSVRQGEFSWPWVRISGFVRMDALGSRGGRSYRREGNKDPVKHVGEKAHFAQDASEAAHFVSDDKSNPPLTFLGEPNREP